MFSGFHDVSARSPELYPDIEGLWTRQRKWEIEALLDILRDRQDRNILEIGSADGGTLRLFMQAIKPGARFVSVDLAFPEKVGRLWADAHGHTLNVILGRSQSAPVKEAVVKAVPVVDFLFIDGGHSYSECRSDFNIYGRLIRPGGLIGLHDILFTPAEPWLEPHRLWTDIREAGFITQEIITGRDNGPGGIGLVYI